MPYRLATPQYVQGPRLWPPAENNEAASPELPGLPYPAIAGRADTLDSHYGATHGTRTRSLSLEDWYAADYTCAAWSTSRLD